MNHAELVSRAVRWLANTQRCSIVMSELVTSACESPDAIGWRQCGVECVYVECKASVADFLADRRKTSRRHPRMAMGHFRYYFTPPGLLNAQHLSEGWGLVEVDKRCRIIIKATRLESNRQQELAMFYSAAHRWAHDNVRVFAVPTE